VANPNGAGADELSALSEVLCFDVCAAGRAITRAYRPLLSGLGLTYPQYLVMMALRQGPPRTVTELGDRLALDSGTLSPLLKRLDASGLVTRGRRHDDERAVEVALTAKGTVLLRAAGNVPTKMAAVMGLSARAGRQLSALLMTLTASLAHHHAAVPCAAAGPRTTEALRLAPAPGGYTGTEQ
jgi:DNA-binding MarR family transcriptional regulator